MRSTMSQTGLLLKHLLENDHVTPAEAKEVYGISRLAARIRNIYELTGHHVDRETRTDPMGRRYTRYYIHPKRRPIFKRHYQEHYR